MNLYEIGDRIKKLRKEHKMTQAELATLAGVSRVTLSKIERGYFGSVSVKTLDVIVNALGCEIDLKTKNSFGLPVLGE
ncbi:MAG: helix-turn-helix transcriptional regulator [Epsilonproteobacteria bacterium]|nr:helix-turn-helix transcriptional regulator [Campylobacterota bacterium]